MCRAPLRFLQLSFMPLEPYPARYARHLPHAGKGTSPAVDRVLSLTAHLRRIFHLFHLSFIPPVPYPPLRGTFPSRGRLTIRGKPAVKRPSSIAPYIFAALRSFDSVLPFQISHSSYLRKAMTKLCIKILVEANSAIESACP